ncbi:MAG: protein-glutamate O-methyltransferase CheR [Proteobacteria bacterium]|nr:MAG: protein-glutamate O-methyltransferase CheR [Pseudomonadota bacterium]
MEERKSAMLSTRLRKRMRVLGINTFQAYLERLEQKGTEVQEFINLITTNETFFFRTTAVWDFFEKEFLPKWRTEKAGQPVRIWSAASSSGAEAYSLAMACAEARVEFRIFGSDISTAILAEAKIGEYDGRVAADLEAKRPAWRAKYFEKNGDTIRFKPLLRPFVEFAPHNLFAAPPKVGHFDFVFLRNVLIYFTEPDQEKVLAQMAASLSADGLLALGESESLSRMNTPFTFVAPLIYRKGDKK